LRDGALHHPVAFKVLTDLRALLIDFAALLEIAIGA
jgi:hypothetical protein